MVSTRRVEISGLYRSPDNPLVFEISDNNISGPDTYRVKVFKELVKGEGPVWTGEYSHCSTSQIKLRLKIT